VADRWSNPSGSIGIERFRVWPSGGDSYDHAENAANWDNLDAILGIPASGEWPPTLGVGGGIYKEIQDLKVSDIPVGAVIGWIRPTAAVPIPSGFSTIEGQTIAAVDHDFPGISTSVTLPDLRNRFLLGADSAKAPGTAAVAVGSPSINTAAGAPGPQGTGGENQHLLTVAEAAGVTFTSGSAMVGTTQSWPSISPALSPFVRTAGATAPASPHENRPAWVGLIWLVKLLNTS
jgi:hypothetical protein